MGQFWVCTRTRQDDCGRPWGWDKVSCILFSLSDSQSLYKTVRSSGEILLLCLTEIFGLHPAQCVSLQKEGSALHTPRQLSNVAGIQPAGFRALNLPLSPHQTWMLPPDQRMLWARDSNPHPPVSSEKGNLARRSHFWHEHCAADPAGDMAVTSPTPLTFPGPLTVHIHSVDVGFCWAPCQGEPVWASRYLQAGSVSSPQEFIYGISRGLFQGLCSTKWIYNAAVYTFIHHPLQTRAYLGQDQTMLLPAGVALAIHFIA